MAFNISAWSIKNPLGPLLLSVTLVVLGIQSFRNLPITRLPNVDIPVIAVTVTQFGAAPAELESQVTKSIEDAVSGIEGIQHINSSITDWVSTTSIAFRLGTDTDRALNDVKDAVMRVRPGLPRNIDEPLVQRVDLAEGIPIVTYAVIAPGKTPEDLAWFVDDVVKRELQSIRGIGRVDRIGGAEREILVSLDPTRLRSVGLTASDVSRRLRATNVDLAGGRADIGGHSQSIRTLAGARTVALLAGTQVALPAGGEVRLDDLGEVTDTIAERRTFARLDGEPVVGFGILRSRGASDVGVAKAVAARIAKIEAAHKDVQIKLIDSSVDFTLGTYEAAMSTLYEGAILAVVVVFFFLRDLRATVIAAIALPLSILPTFWVMSLLGFSLNRVSLMAITLSVGILVDDAIVEIENIVRHMRMGKSAYQAALDASQEIGLTVVAISLAIVAVFAPTSFLSSVIGHFFREFGITVAIQVLFSLLAARLVTPMLAAYFLRSPRHHGSEDGSLGRLSMSYVGLVGWSIRHRYITVVVGFVLFALSLLSTLLLPSGFMPVEDTGRTLLAVELPPGSQLSETETVTELIARRLRERREVQSVFVDGGRSSSGLPEVRKATLFIRAVKKHERSVTQREIERAIARELSEIPDIRYWFLNEETGLRPVKLIVTGQNDDEVASVASELAAQMQALPAFSNVIANVAVDRPEIRILPELDLAIRFGVVTESLADTIRVATIGDVAPNLARFDAGSRLVPIRVLLRADARANPQALEQLGVPTARGTIVPLSVIADIRFGHGPITIGRFDRSRQATVEAELSGTAALSEALDQIRATPVMKNISERIRIQDAGDAEQMKDLQEGFAKALREGLLMVFGVLVLLFKSLLQPLTILVSLPLSVGGAILALVATDKPMNLPVMVGILMLMGIVTKNAIMLVDFAIEEMAKGIERTKAIVEACLKRARPIIMTTVAMAAGMVPSALGIGAGGEFRSPMAIAVIGGLMVSTFLSLLFVPSFFAMMDDAGRLAWRVFGRFVDPDAALGARPSSPEQPLEQGKPEAQT